MSNKSIYLLAALFIGAFFFFQSCSDNTITQSTALTDAGSGNLIPNHFFGSGAGFPKKCPSGPQRLELWAGAGNASSATLVGYVEFLNVTSTSMTVKYVLNATPWVLTAVHFHISDNLAGIPVNKSGNPVPGQFQYGFDIPISSGQTSYSFQVTLPADPGNDGYFVAAHSGVCKTGNSLNLPTSAVNMCVTAEETQCGYRVLNLTNAGNYNGSYCGYCIDADHWGLNAPNCFTTYLYSSYGTLPQVILNNVARPGNLDLVNWIINNFIPGSTQVAKYGYIGAIEPPYNWNISSFYLSGLQTNNIVTSADIQVAIWFLLENGTGQINTSQVDISRVLGIIHQALTTPGAEGFVPNCNQKIAVIAVPYTAANELVQAVIIPVQLTCGSTDCETAWGDGKYGAMFPNAKQWGTYFNWDDVCH